MFWPNVNKRHYLTYVTVRSFGGGGKAKIPMLRRLAPSQNKWYTLLYKDVQSRVYHLFCNGVSYTDRY